MRNTYNVCLLQGGQVSMVFTCKARNKRHAKQRANKFIGMGYRIGNVEKK